MGFDFLKRESFSFLKFKNSYEIIINDRFQFYVDITYFEGIDSLLDIISTNEKTSKKNLISNELLKSTGFIIYFNDECFDKLQIFQKNKINKETFVLYVGREDSKSFKKIQDDYYIKKYGTNEIMNDTSDIENFLIKFFQLEN